MKKMVESHLRWFGHVWRRLIEVSVRRVDQMKSSPIVRDREAPKKTIGKTTKRDLNFNGLNVNMIQKRTL